MQSYMIMSRHWYSVDPFVAGYFYDEYSFLNGYSSTSIGNLNVGFISRGCMNDKVCASW